MRNLIIICDTCGKKLHLAEGWNDPYYVELIECKPISTSIEQLVHQFYSMECVLKFLVEEKVS